MVIKFISFQSNSFDDTVFENYPVKLIKLLVSSLVFHNKEKIMSATSLNLCRANSERRLQMYCADRGNWNYFLRLWLFKLIQLGFIARYTYSELHPLFDLLGQRIRRGNFRFPPVETIDDSARHIQFDLLETEVMGLVFDLRFSEGMFALQIIEACETEIQEQFEPEKRRSRLIPSFQAIIHHENFRWMTYTHTQELFQMVLERTPIPPERCAEICERIVEDHRETLKDLFQWDFPLDANTVLRQIIPSSS